MSKMYTNTIQKCGIHNVTLELECSECRLVDIAHARKVSLSDVHGIAQDYQEGEISLGRFVELLNERRTGLKRCGCQADFECKHDFL
jgi:hypothetical protein